MTNRRRPAVRTHRPSPHSTEYGSLEQRSMMAGPGAANPLAPAGSPLLTTLASTPPAFTQQPAVVGSAVVTERTAQLSVLASDDGGERNLQYFWKAESVPAQGGIQFSSSGSNAAKSTRLTFTAAGTYQVSVRAVDRLGLSTSTLLTIQVNQTAKSIAIRNGNNRVVNSGSVNSLPGIGQAYSAVVLDQFGRPLTTQPNLNWSIVTRPTGSTPQLTQSGSGASVQFNRTGDYLLRAIAANLSSEFTVRVAPVLSRVAISQLNGTAVSSGASLAVAGTATSLQVVAFDQFDLPLASLTGLQWSASTLPSGGKLGFSSSGAVVNFTFNRAGAYVARCVSPAGTSQIQFNVSQVLTAVRVNSGASVFSPGSTSAWTGSQANLAATAVDQFGQPLAAQPTFAWTLAERPTGSLAAGSFSANQGLVAFDRVGAYTIRVAGGAAVNQFRLNVTPVLTSLTAETAAGTALSSGVPSTISTRTQTVRLWGYDQFGQALSPLPKLNWTTVSAPFGGRVNATLAGQLATFAFNRAGNYTISANGPGELFRFSFAVQSVLSQIEPLSSAGKIMPSGSRAASSGGPTSFSARAIDQFGQPLAVQPTIAWSATQVPGGANPTLGTSGNSLSISFERAGGYTFEARVGEIRGTVGVDVKQQQTSMEVTPGTVSVEAGAEQAFTARLLDQFSQPMATQPGFGWTASGGTISTGGVYQAGALAGSYVVTARIGTLTRTANVTVTAAAGLDNFSNADIRGMVNSAHSDGQISRSEMIAILRSLGDNGSVTASELADARYLLAPSSPFGMPDHVRNLASDVVTGNQANATYQRLPLGNLAAGSSESHLNRLVDKWFLGTDLPILTSNSLQYRPASGPLFVASPGLNDARQGMLGDCYLIASLASIAARNPSAIQDMFIDNGDGTFTLRFYGGNYGSFYTAGGLISSGFTSGRGVVDYVTVNRQLATFSNGAFAYSNYGIASTSSSAPLWIALAEKGYAQWNQTGAAGRDGTLNFSAIEGGWMSDVNAQVLGYNSTMYHFQSTASQTLINALNSGQAVTLGTRSSPGISDLVGGHAYTVSGYNSGTGRFVLHNPWGTSHPAPLTWSQLVSSCTAFVAVNPNGSGAVSSSAWPASSYRLVSSEARLPDFSAVGPSPSERMDFRSEATAPRPAVPATSAEGVAARFGLAGSEPIDSSLAESPGEMEVRSAGLEDPESSGGPDRIAAWQLLDRVHINLTLV